MTSPRALATLDGLRPERNRVQVENILFTNNLPSEVQFVVILAGQRASIVLGQIPDEICNDWEQIAEWLMQQRRAIADAIAQE